MQKLTQAGDNLVNDLSMRYNLSRDAVIHMMVSVNNGGCSMAQFSCPELGGSGQWMRGGMTMVGDMFNHGLKMTVDNLCEELANGLTNLQVFPVIPAGTPGSSQWWPADCGSPFSSGAQNNTRYAVFPGKLAVELNGQVTVYDTLNHNIGGVSQQQGGDNSLTFSSQFGTISVNQLPIISGAAIPDANNSQNNTHNNTNFTQAPEPQFVQPETFKQQAPANTSNIGTSSTDEVIGLIEKLAKLRDAGALSEQDFDAKKNELLTRI
jgi:hypothetical protein